MGVTNITEYVKELEESVKRIDEIERMIANWKLYFKENNIPDVTKDYPTINQSVKNTHERIATCEKTISQLVDKIAEIANFYYKEKQAPYKCPVCDGVSHLHRSNDKEKLKNNFEFYREYASCHACEGSGILWK